MFSIERARKLLEAANVFHAVFEEGYDEQTLNQNDVWCWACAESEHVTDEELPEVAELFWNYGWCGIVYWVSKKNGDMRSEFADVNRFIDFVAAEEEIRKEVPESSKRAYTKREYSIGGN